MFKKEGKTIKLVKSADFPGYEIISSEEITIESIMSNPFFHGINILALSKKMKGIRNNKDLRHIFEPVKISTNIQADFSDNQFITFVPNKKFSNDFRLFSIQEFYGPLDLIEPSFVNLGLKDIKISKGELLGIVFIQTISNIDN